MTRLAWPLAKQACGQNEAIRSTSGECHNRSTQILTVPDSAARFIAGSGRTCRDVTGRIQTVADHRPRFSPLPWGIRMFDWIRRVFEQPNDDEERQRFFETLDALNAEAGGGQPNAVTKVLGSLKLRSGCLAIGDPQYMPGLEVPNIATDELTISASLWRYPSGQATIAALTLGLGDPPSGGPYRKIGEVAIDSAKVVVADKANIDDHWTEVGKDRIGVILTAPDDTVLRMLSKRFKLRTVRVNRVRAEVVGPVSDALAKEIEDHLKSSPEYAEFAHMYFWVETNNSFDRANHMAKAWDFLPIGNNAAPLMFVCGTGRGDGCYEVQGQFAGEVPRILTITFIKD